MPNIPAGQLYYWAYQKGAGTNKHSGNAGKRGGRFYQGRFAHKVVVKRK